MFRGPCIVSIFLLIYFQQDATLHSLFQENCSTCLGWYFHPSSGAHTTVFTVSGTCQTVHRKYIPFDIFPTRCNITQFISGKLLYMLGVVFPPIIRSTHNCIYSIWYLSNRYCYLPLLWKSWNWFECGVGILLICFGSPKHINTIPTPHSNQFQLFHYSGS